MKQKNFKYCNGGSRTCLTVYLVLNFFYSIAQGNINTDSLIKICHSNIDDSVKVTSLLSLASFFSEVDSDSSLFYAYKANILSKKNKLINKEAESLLLIGKAYEKKYNLDKALMYVNRALTIDSLANNKNGMARAFAVIAIINYKSDDFENSIFLFHKGLKLFEETGNKEQIAVTLANIGSVYAQMNQIELAIEYAQKAIGYFKNEEKSSGYLTALSVLTQSFLNLSDFEKALSYNKEMLNYSEKLNNVRGIIHCFNMYGTIYEAMNDFESAIKYLHKAIEVSGLHNISPNAITTAWYNIAVVYTNSHQYEKALPIYLRCIKEFETLKNKNALNQTYIAISELYVNMKKYKLAYEFLLKHKSLNDSLFSEKNTKQINAIRIKYETNKKEEEIRLLQEKNKTNELELEKKKSDIKIRTFIAIASILIALLIIFSMYFLYKHNKLKQQKSAAELEHKALRAQMNPHFIFNALNSIQRKYIEGNNDEANEFMGDFAALMRKILDNSNKSYITLHEEINTLKLYLDLEKLRCKNQFNYLINIEENIDVYSINIPPLIIQPFVENAIWHGILPKTQKGNVVVNISQENNKLKFVIKDDGVGINTNAVSKLKSKGLQITEQRIGTKVIIDSELNKGTSITFYIKI